MGCGRSRASAWGPLPRLLWGEGGRPGSCPRTVSRLPAAAPVAPCALRSSANTAESEWKERPSERGTSGPCRADVGCRLRRRASCSAACVSRGRSASCFSLRNWGCSRGRVSLKVMPDSLGFSECKWRQETSRPEAQGAHLAEEGDVGFRCRPAGLSRGLSLHIFVALRSHFCPFKSSTFSSSHRGQSRC